MAQDLREFFLEKKQRAKPADADWESRRDTWVAAVKDLYDTIENDYLQTAKAEVEISRPIKLVTENDIGEYHIPEFCLRAGDEQVIFSPKGTNLIGARGRIDVQADRGDANIVWMPDDRWSIVASRTPTLRLVPLTAESFAEMLRSIMRP